MSDDEELVPGWPRGVRRISLHGLGDLGAHVRTNELYYMGEKVVTEKRFSSFERGLAVVGLVIAGVGVAATVVQAWAAVAALS